MYASHIPWCIRDNLLQGFRFQFCRTVRDHLTEFCLRARADDASPNDSLRKFKQKAIFFSLLFSFSETSQGKATDGYARIYMSLKTNAYWKDGEFGLTLNSQKCWKSRTLINDSSCILMPSMGQLLLNWSRPHKSVRTFRKGTYMWKCKENMRCVSFQLREAFLHWIAFTFRAGPPNLCGLNKPCLWVFLFSSVSFRHQGCQGALCLPGISTAAADGQCHVLGVFLVMIVMIESW